MLPSMATQTAPTKHISMSSARASTASRHTSTPAPTTGKAGSKRRAYAGESSRPRRPSSVGGRRSKAYSSNTTKTKHKMLLHAPRSRLRRLRPPSPPHGRLRTLPGGTAALPVARLGGAHGGGVGGAVSLLGRALRRPGTPEGTRRALLGAGEGDRAGGAASRVAAGGGGGVGGVGV
jgi:hypothetical protein